MAKDEREHESRLNMLRRRARARGMIIRECLSDRTLFDLMDHPDIEHALQTKWADGVSLDGLEATLDEMGATA